MTAAAPSETPILEVQGLVKRYGQFEALSGLDLRVRPGEVYGFLGRNGAGKSTTIRCIMGITRPSEGGIKLFGEALKGASVSLRQRIGYVAQEQNFYGWMTPRSLGRFVGALYPTWDDGEFKRLAKRIELPTDRKIRTFSGGMKVKLGLCLALAHRPPLLVLDEPTAGLDPVARREFLDMVRQQAEESGRTTFFSTHLMDEVEQAASRLGIVDGGRCIYEGDLSGLIARVRLWRPFAQTEAAPSNLAAAEGILQELAPGIQVLSNELRRGRQELNLRSEDPSAFANLRAGHPHGELIELSLEDALLALVTRSLGAAAS